MVCMIPPVSITILSTILEIELSDHYTVCVPEQNSFDLRGYVRAIQIHIIGF